MVNMKILELISVAAAAVVASVYIWAKQHYRQIASAASNANPAINSYIENDNPPFLEKLQCVILNLSTKWTRNIHEKPFALVAQDHKYIPGLKRTRAARNNEEPTRSSKPKPPLVIGTIRMGFGHHRISYAVASHALDKSEDITSYRDVYFHDIATIGDDESSLVDDAETAYSLGSRALTELPNQLERFISRLTSQGGPNALRMQVQVALLLVSLIKGLDHDSPIIATHPLVGAMAVAANFTNVVNLVVDNHPQWFVVVPGALNLVQGPRLYRELVKLGVPDAEIELVGHWNPRNIVETIPQATQRRIERVSSSQPLRLLIPLGGAGAQQSFLTELVKRCLPLVKQGKLQLLLNAGDHEHMKVAFEDLLQASQMEYESIFDVNERNQFVDSLKSGNEPKHPLTLFAFKTSYASVTTTDELVPYSDVLVAKPSELAFYAVPKLMIRRVGDHEAKSAVRAAEVGEGTLEAGTVDEVMEEIRQFLSKPSDLITMNKMIRKNNEVGMYDGAKVAVEKALARA